MSIQETAAEMVKCWAPDLVGQSTALTHHMDLTEPNRLCAVKMKKSLGVTFLIDTTVVKKHHDWLGGAIVGMFIRGPSRLLNLGEWFRVVVPRGLELPTTRAVRRCRDHRGEDPTWLIADVAEQLVKSRRVDGTDVLRCEDWWPNGLEHPPEDVDPGKECGQKKHGRHGVIWGNIAEKYRETTLWEFMPIIWWREDQVVVMDENVGPYLAYPKRFGDAATTWQSR